MTTIDLNRDPEHKQPELPLPKEITEENWSDSSDDSDVKSPSIGEGAQQPQQVEWLATSRAKRSTAGNRMKSMLANEEPAAEDSDLELLFAEDDDDAGFTDEDKDDASDVQMDSSSDDEDDKEGAAADDLEGEKELERQAREKRNAQRKRKAQEAIPMKFRKKVRIEQPPSATGESATGSPAPSTTGTPAASSVRQGPIPRPPRPKKKSERTSWLPTPADMPTRASERRTTKMSKEQLHQKMIDDEIRRKKLMEKMEKNAKRLEALKKPPMTQAERLAEAALVEKRNEKSLNRWEEAEKVREEERLRKIAALNNRKLDGPVVTFWSGIQTLEEGQQKHVGKMVSMEEKPVRKKRQSVSATLAAQEAAEKEKAKAEEASKQTSLTEKGDDKSAEAAIKQDDKVEAQAENAVPSIALPEQPQKPISTPDVVMKDAPEPPQPPQPSTLAPIRGPMAPPPIPSPPPLETKPAPSSGVLAAPVLAPPGGVAPPMLDVQMPGLAFPFSNGMSNVLAPPNTTSPLSMPPSSGSLSTLTPAPAPTSTSALLSAPVTSVPTTTLSFAPTHIPAPAPAPAPAVDRPPRDLPSPATTVFTTTIQTKQAPTPPSSQSAAVSSEQLNKEEKSAVPQKGDKTEQSDKGEESRKENKSDNANTGPDRAQEGSSVPTDQAAAEGEEGKTVDKVTRSCIILQNFDEAAIKDKQVQTQIIFGRRMEKLAKPAHPPLCVVTGHPARYRDPKTGLPYYNAYAYREIQRVHRGDYKFSALLGAYVGSGTYAAKGVPERFLNPNGKRSTPKEDPAVKLAKLKEAQEAEKRKEKTKEAMEMEKAKEIEAGDKNLDNVQATELPPLRQPKLPQLPRRASGTEVTSAVKARSKSKKTTRPSEPKRKTSTSSLPATMTGPVVQAKLEPIEGVALPLKVTSAPALTPTVKPMAAAATTTTKANPPLSQLSTPTPPLQTQAQFRLVDDDVKTQTQQLPVKSTSSSNSQPTPQASQPQPQPQVQQSLTVPAPVSTPIPNPAAAPSSSSAVAAAPTQPPADDNPVKSVEPTQPSQPPPPSPPAQEAAAQTPIAETRFLPAPVPDMS
ncbi:YL1 nuclear domain-containing protein [Neurospora intermedia]|uniref:YL1 nuclear domain-containing protein n=1 Tax=Neurospora intermedia TaxID=5142 RepID=A0ABR3DPK9_NEUIN